MMFGFFILLLFLQRSDAGILCSKQAMTYQTAIDSCFLQNGKPVEILQANKDSVQDELGNRLSVWTKYYANTSSDCNKINRLRVDTVCGYQYYMVHTTSKIEIFNETRYVDCKSKKKDACERGKSHIYRLFEKNFEATRYCNFTELEKWKDKATTGYYWVPYSRTSICLLNADGPIQRDEELPNCLGYAYDIDDGHYKLNYIACSSLRTMLCEFNDDGHVPTGYGACKTVGYTSTTIVKETTTIQTNSTQKSESTNSPDLGLYIGVSVAACVILLVVVFLICYRHRRAHAKHKKGNNQSENASGSESDGNILATKTFVSISNRSYHSTSHQDEDQYIYIDDHDNDNDKNINPHEGTDDGHYDTTFSKTSPSSMATNDYDVMDQIKHEDVYNTTRTVRQGNQVTDNIYNRLDTAVGDEENISDKTLSQQRHQRSQVIDDTYNTLNNC